LRVEIAAVLVGVVEIVVAEKTRTFAPRRGELVSPRWKQSNVDAVPCCLVDDLHHAIEVVVVRTLRIVILKGHQTQRCRLLHAAELREHHSLNHGETLSRPRVQIVGALGPGCGLDELPGCISKPEERRSVVSGEIVTLVVHNNTRQWPV